LGYLPAEHQWFVPEIPAFRRQRQEDHKFEAAWPPGEFKVSLGYIARPCPHTHTHLILLYFAKAGTIIPTRNWKLLFSVVIFTCLVVNHLN
jgi:hypothetical protein